jgi:ATP-dependent Clp protease, protease subunit
MKSFFKTVVREGGRGRFGLGIELFRLAAVEEDDLTDEEKEAIEEEDSKDSTAIMRVYEEIGENFWDGTGMSVKKFAEELDKIGDVKNLHIHINSLGGDTHTAQAIYNLIGDHPSNSISYIDGVAASAATVVASGAKHVVMRHNANYMIHNPWTIAMGNAEVMRKAADDLDKVTEPIVNVYKDQTGNKTSRAKIQELMNEETWLTADEALGYGFVDEVRGKTKPISKASSGRILCCGRIMNIGKYQYRHVPDYPVSNSPDLINLQARHKLKQNGPKPPKGKMTLEELQQVDPDLVASIRASAGEAERTRLAALNAMRAPGLDAIIEKAITDGATPASIALECLNVVNENNASQARVDSLKRDAAGANGVPASDAPYVSPNKQQQEKRSATKDLSDAIAKDPRQIARAKTNGRLMLS